MQATLIYIHWPELSHFASLNQRQGDKGLEGITQILVYEFLTDAVTNCHKHGGSKQQIYSLMILKVQSLKRV
jgi:hypothetical protein